jgi:hypothetical protein
MKGVIFSADFVDDGNDDIRLLEFNTDTGFSNYVVENLLDFSGMCDLINNNNIAEIHIIHKPQIHKEFVSAFSNNVNLNCPTVISITEYKEILDSVYPEGVDDAVDRLIIRLAYDELAIFDSEYCKNTLNLFNLFIENGETGSVAQIYHTSSLYGKLDTIGYLERNDNLPDVVRKRVSTPHFNTEFIKFNQSGSISDYFDEYISHLEPDDVIQKYHISNTALTQTNVYSNRGYFFIYGDDLDLIPISIFSMNTLLPIPDWETVLMENSLTNDSYVLSKKHYYEFATNTLNQSIISADGIYESETIISSSNIPIPIKNSEIGMEIKSIFLGGDAPNTDDYIELYRWGYSGSTLPIDSEPINSFIMNVKKIDNHSNLIHQIIFEDDTTIESSYFKPLLVYNSEKDITKYLQAGDLTDVHFVYKLDGGLLKVSQSRYIIPNDDTSTFISINTEDSDLYILSGSNIVVHNAPCFVAGTKITMADYTEINIEDIIVGDTIVSHNLKKSINENDVVESVTFREVDITISYIFDDNDMLEATVDHPIYVKDKGWASYNNKLSNNMYNIGNVSKIKVGDFVKTINGYTKIKDIIKNNKCKMVYNLSKIRYNSNFFANKILVHNRAYDVVKQ